MWESNLELSPNIFRQFWSVDYLLWWTAKTFGLLLEAPGPPGPSPPCSSWRSAGWSLWGRTGWTWSGLCPPRPPACSSSPTVCTPTDPGICCQNPKVGQSEKKILRKGFHAFNVIRQGVRSRSCLSAERRHFSSPRKKHFYFTKSFPNGIIGCVERGFYKKITRSPVSGDQVIRCCSDLMFPPKRDFILKKSLFLDGVHVQMINLFINKFTHRLSALPQPYCSLSRFQFLIWSFIIAELPTLWLPPCFLPCTPMFCLFWWHLKLTLGEWRLYLGVADISFQLESEKNYHNYN